jgi:transposase-like protein
VPYASEKIKIEGTQFDRRIKVTEELKDEILDRYFNKGYSMRALSRELKLDRQTIKYTLFPNYKEEFMKNNRERAKPEYTREKLNEYSKRHRHHKQELYLKGLIKKEVE